MIEESMGRRGLLAAAGLAALGWAPGAQAAETAAPAAAQPAKLDRVPLDAPVGQLLDGEVKRLSEFGAKPVLVVFWASWCPYCRAEMPEMERLQASAKDLIRIVAINVEERAIFHKLNRVLAKTSVVMQTYDPDEVSARAFAKPGSLPYTVLLRPDRTIAATQAGWGDGSMEFILKHVNQVLQDAMPGGA